MAKITKKGNSYLVDGVPATPQQTQKIQAKLGTPNIGMSQSQLSKRALEKVFGKGTPSPEEKITEQIQTLKATEPIKQKFAVDKEVAAQESKMAAESRRNKNKARFQLIQTGLLYDQMSKWNKKNLPNIPKGGRAEGLANIILGEKLGMNPYVTPFQGDQIETAAALMKIASPSSRGGERLIEMFLKTVPNIWATKKEAEQQLINSLSNSIYQDAVTHPEDYPEIDENSPESYVNFSKKTRERMKEATDLIFDVKKTMGNVKTTQDGVLMRSKSGEVEEVPFKRVAEAKLDGYEEVK